MKAEAGLVVPLTRKRSRRDPIDPPPIPENETDIVVLVRQLVARVRRENGSCAATPDDVVLLSLDCEGIRCQITRIAAAPSALEEATDDARELLSPREQEIARMVARGYPNKTIAKVLDLSVWTVGTYLRRIFAKLQVNSRAAMVARIHESHLCG